MNKKELLIKLEELFNSIEDEQLKESALDEFQKMVQKRDKIVQIMIDSSEILNNTLGSKNFDSQWRKELFNQWMDICQDLSKK